MAQDQLVRNGSSALGNAAFVCGLLALLFNLILIALPIGTVLGLIALILACLTIRKGKEGRAGLVLSLLSFLILAIWITSIIVMTRMDPALLGGLANAFGF